MLSVIFSSAFDFKMEEATVFTKKEIEETSFDDFLDGTLQFYKLDFEENEFFPVKSTNMIKPGMLIAPF